MPHTCCFPALLYTPTTASGLACALRLMTSIWCPRANGPDAARGVSRSGGLTLSDLTLSGLGPVLGQLFSQDSQQEGGPTAPHGNLLANGPCIHFLLLWPHVLTPQCLWGTSQINDLPRHPSVRVWNNAN